MGGHVLREVYLRTWYKNDFKNEILSNKDALIHSLRTYLRPLIKEYESANSWNETLKEIITDTLLLWSYLSSPDAAGKLELIQPNIEDLFDPKLHKAIDGDDEFDENSEQELSKEEEAPKRIKWVLRRGFKYKESSFEGLRSITIEALVAI
jgi:molecular chaperone GrpE (heat shock protein)